MNAEGIEKLVHKIRGTFPSQQVSFNAVIDTWQQDEFLLKTKYETALKVMPMVEKYGKFPSLPDFRNMVAELTKEARETIACDKCDGTGWDTGLDMMYLGPDQWQIVRWGYTQTFKNHTYTAAVKCNCGN